MKKKENNEWNISGSLKSGLSGCYWLCSQDSYTHNIFELILIQLVLLELILIQSLWGGTGDSTFLRNSLITASDLWATLLIVLHDTQEYLSEK